MNYRSVITVLLMIGALLARAGAADQPSLSLLAAPLMSEADGVLALGVELSAPQTTDTPVTITAAPLTPASTQIVIKAGDTRAVTMFFLADDQLLQGFRQAVLRASAPGFTSALWATLIEDDDVADISVLLPATLVEGGSTFGVITLSRPAAYAVDVTATISNGAIGHPGRITIPPGITSYAFYLQAGQNDLIAPDQNCTVTLSIPRWNKSASSTVLVTNDDPKELSLQVGEVREDNRAEVGTVLLSGVLEAPLEVTLTSGDTSLLAVPATVTIPAGSRFATFPLTPVNDPAATGARTVTVKAASAGFTEGTGLVTVVDTTLFSLRSQAESTLWLRIGATERLPIDAVSKDGRTIRAFPGELEAVWENDATGETLGTPVKAAFSFPFGQQNPLLNGGTALPEVPVPNVLGRLRLRVTSGTVTARTPAMRTYRQIDGKAVQVEVDPVRGNLLYTSGPLAPTGFANTVVTVNPLTGATSVSPFIGNDPRQLAITDDGSYAYAALWSSGQVVQVNLGTGSVVRTFSLSGKGPPWDGYTYHAYDLETVPGLPDNLIVAQNATASSYSPTVYYRNGNVLADSWPTNLHSLARSRRPGVVYGQNTTDSGYDFGTLTGTADTLTLNTYRLSAIYGYDIEADGDLVVGTNGVVMDGTTLKSRGTLARASNSGPSVVGADTASRRLYLMEGNNLNVYDSSSLRKISTVPLPAATDGYIQFRRWGDNGLALVTANGNVVIVTHSDIAPSQPPADLAVTFEKNDGILEKDTAKGFAITVTNRGPNPAVAPRLNLTYPSSLTLGGLENGDATVENSSLGFVARIPDLPAGSSRTLRFTFTSTVTSQFIIEASTTSDSKDDNPADNLASQSLSVIYPDTPNTQHLLPTYALDIIAHPAQPLVYLTTGSGGDPGLEGRVLELDPRTGLVRRTLFLGYTPGVMAITDGGEYLYVGLQGVSKIIRVRLSDFTKALEIDMPNSAYGNYTAGDLATLPGRPESVAVAMGYYGIYVLDNNTARANHTGVYEGSRIERGPGGTLLAYDDYTSGFELNRLTINAAGLTLDSSRSPFQGYSVDFTSSGNFALSSTGALVDTTSLTLRGYLPGVSYTGGTPALEPGRQRAYGLANGKLTSFETGTLTALRGVTIPGTSLRTIKAIRWGEDGFAVLQRSDNYYYTTQPNTGQIVLLRSDMVPTAAPYEVELLMDTPLAPSGVVTSPTLALGGRAFAVNGVASLTVNGSDAGPIDANGRWSHTLTLSPGVNEIHIVATSGAFPAVHKETVLTYAYHTAALGQWIAASLPGQENSATALADDTDGDGWNGLAELALNGNPAVAAPLVTPVANDPLVFSFQRPVGSRAATVFLKLQVTSDLKTWRTPEAAEVQWLEPGPADASGNYRQTRFRLGAEGPARHWRLWISTEDNAITVGSPVP